MHYEYAVEPQAIASSWENFRYLIEKFGFDKGRLISQFPKSWFREVYQAADALSPLQKKKLEEALNKAKNNKVVRSGRNHDPSLGQWLDSALIEHQRQPFHAIIACNTPGSDPSVLPVDTIDESEPLMKVPRGNDIQRDISSIASALKGLLHHGTRLAFVDPYFDPFNARQKKLFRELFRIISDNNPGANCEVHYRKDARNLSNDVLEREAATLFGDVIPSGMKVSFYCWCEKDKGEDFHARYLLTEKGGISIDAGFDPVGSQETTDFTLMDNDLVLRRLAAISRDANVYELIEPIVAISSDGTVEEI